MKYAYLNNSVAPLAMLAASIPSAFNNQPAWKTGEDGAIELRDGNPVLVNSSGQEQIVAIDTISRLNGEAKSHRERAEAAETKLKSYDGIADPDAARKALETVGKLDAKSLIDAGEVDRVKQEISGQFTEQLAEKDNRIAELTGSLDNMVRSNAFQGSKFIRERVAVPYEMFERTFAGNVKIEEGKPVVYSNEGNRIFSKERVGEHASFDEAMQILVETSPWKDQILKAPEHSGSGNNGGGGNNGGKATMKRSEFDRLSQQQQVEAAQKARKGELVIAD